MWFNSTKTNTYWTLNWDTLEEWKNLNRPNATHRRSWRWKWKKVSCCNYFWTGRLSVFQQHVLHPVYCFTIFFTYYCCHFFSFFYYVLILEERRLKDAQRKKAERQMAKLFTSEEKKGTNFMIMHDMMQFNPFNSCSLIHNFTVACCRSSAKEKRRTSK